MLVGTRPVEEAITQSNTLEARIAEKPILDRRVGRDEPPNFRRGYVCEIVPVRKKAGGLDHLPLDAIFDRGTVQIATAF
jgi:hypothetical protein